MAIIGKIREKSSLTLILLGVAMLAFIMGNYESMFGASNRDIGIGEVLGEKVDPRKYDNAVQNSIAQDQQQFSQSQRQYTPADQKASIDKAWSMTVNSIILEKEYEDLHIDVSKSELDAYLYGTDGFTLMPNIAQSFVDSITGQFNPRLLENYIQQQESSTDAAAKTQWENLKLNFVEQRKNEKYFQLITQGAYVTKLEAEEEYKAQKEMKSISYVVRRYSEIPDASISISDDEVKAFYDEHKNEKKYESTAGRDVNFFDIAISPSKADSSKFNKLMLNLKKQFSTSKNDSLFVIANSDFKFFTSTNQSTLRPEGDAKARPGFTFPLFMDTLFKSALPGQIVGPYNDQGKVRLAKVRSFNTNILKVRHILISAPKGDSLKLKSASKMADSLVKLITKENFAEFVTKYSEDPGSKQTGGVYEDFMDYEMVPEFSNFAILNPVGKIGAVKTDFGIHIMEVLDKKLVKYPVVSLIEKTLLPSEETETKATDDAYNILYKLDEKISRKSSSKAKLAAFDTIAKKAGFFVRPVKILDENPKAQGFVSDFAEDRILKLAYDESSEIGTLCSAPIKDQNRFIIAIVSSIREKGMPELIDVEASMRDEVLKQKKAARFMQQMSSTKNLETLAKKGKTIVNKSEIVFSNAQIQGGGFEPEIVGTLFGGIKDGMFLKPLKGEQGVYVIQLNKTTKAPATANFSMESAQLLSSVKSNIQNEAMMALIKLSEVKDNRKFTALGIRR